MSDYRLDLLLRLIKEKHSKVDPELLKKIYSILKEHQYDKIGEEHSKLKLKQKIKKEIKLYLVRIN